MLPKSGFFVPIVIHRTIPDDANLRKQWNSLVDRMPSPQVFYTYEWAASVEAAYRDVLTPWLLLLYENEELKGVAALATQPEQTSASWLSGNTADYCDFLSDPSDREAMLNAVFSELRRARVNELSLSNLPADSPTVPLLRKLAGRYKYHTFLRTAYQCAQVKLGSEEERRTLKSKLNGRKIFRRGMNFLGRQGGVSLVHHTTWESIEPLLQPFSVAHIARFLATGRISNQVDARRRVFLARLARALSRSGWLVLSQLNVGHRAVAWNYGFRFHGSWFWYQPTFETAFEQVSPGYCLLSKLIVESCDTPAIDVVDLGLGAEGYKERVSNAARRTLHATVSSSPTHTIKTAIRHGAARAAKLSPALEAGIRAGIGRLQNAREHSRQSGSTLNWVRGRMAGLLASREEVRFYQWSADCPLSREQLSSTPMELAPLTLEILAQGAMRYEKERETQAYLLRAAGRWKSEGVTGYVLLAQDGKAVHFGWTAPFDGFFMAELNTRLSAPSPNASLIFDCWTPVAARGCDYYGITISLIARQLLGDGRSPWIFSAGSNQSSIRGLARTAFQHRYSMIRRKTLMIQRVEKVVPQTSPVPEVPVGR